jgi:hypothetical protein
MRGCSTPALVVCLELLDQRFAFARADQHGILVATTIMSSSPTTVVRAHKIVAAVQHNDRTIGCIAGRIVIEHVPERTPAADIRPTKVGGNYGGELCTLLHGTVDRFLRRACKRLGGKPQEIKVAPGFGVTTDGRYMIPAVACGFVCTVSFCQSGCFAIAPPPPPGPLRGLRHPRIGCPLVCGHYPALDRKDVSVAGNALL